MSCGQVATLIVRTRMCSAILSALSAPGQKRATYAVSTPTEATRRPAPPAETATANRTWWDGEADVVLRRARRRSSATPTSSGGPSACARRTRACSATRPARSVLEIGAGSGQCSRWLAAHGATVVATDLSAGMVATGVAVNDSLDAPRRGPRAVRAVRRPRPPLRRRVLRHGLHGIRRRAVRRGLRRRHGGGGPRAAARRAVRLLDDPPGAVGLPRRPGAGRAHRAPLVLRPHARTSSRTTRGGATYVEHHRTLGDRVREISAAGLVLVDLVEPEWPEGHDEPWGGWSPLRGRVIPGTAIFVCGKPA